MDAGLEKVVAAETVLSDVDGANGRLIIRGHDVGDLAARYTYEQAAALLWSGFFTPEPDAETLARDLGAARAAAFKRLEAHLPDLARLGDVEGVRAALAMSPDGDDLATAIDLAATTAVATAAIARLRAGHPAVAPNPALGHAHDLLRMMRGADPAPAEAAALDAYMVTTCDHGLNASTFVARAVASTRAGLGSAVIAALSALKGPLHGGAPGPALDMLDAIGSPANAEAWITAALDRGDRLMGFGHRVYRIRDPRADVLRRAVSSLPATSGRLALAQSIETVILARLAANKPSRKLETNVEYYTALLLEALAIPRGSFTCLFACGRVLGWIAHAREQLATGRLVRPASVYVGPRPREAA
ncbi:MAG: citrate synthase [Alphaproteobacteria bacterium]|nr:citrate synthase [Alphaproteobacteria bacterium]